MRLKWIPIALALVLVSGSSFADDAAGGGREGNGGGGVVKNGVYMTFHTAGLYVQPSQAPLEFVPGLNPLIQFIVNFEALGFKSRSLLLNALTPTEQRRYFFTTPDEISPQIMDRIGEEYEKKTHVEPSEFALYAVTDTSSKTTFLLPAFFQLPLPSQMALLFHEAYWIEFPGASYSQVVEAETAFQVLLDRPDDPAKVYDFVSKVGSTAESFEWAVKRDLSVHAMDDLLHADANGNYVILSDLIGTVALNCLNDAHTSSDAALCRDFVNANSVQVMEAHPRSETLKFIARYFDRRFPFVLFSTAEEERRLGWPLIGRCKVYLKAERLNVSCLDSSGAEVPASMDFYLP